MKFCGNCGTKLADDDKFCANCGTRTDDESSASGVNSGAEGNTAPAGEGYYAEPGASVKRGSSVVGFVRDNIIKIVAVAAALILVISLVSFAAPVIGNSVMNLVLSPESYFQHVVKNNVEDSAEDAGGLLETVKDNPVTEDQTMTGSMKVELGDGFSELMSMADLSEVSSAVTWLKNAEVTASVTSDDNKFGAELELGLNGKDITSVEAVIDETTAYFGIPELNKQYVSFDLSQIGLSAALMTPRQQESVEKVFDAIPEEKVTSDLVNKYVEIAVENIGPVSESKATVTAGDVSLKCKQLTTYIDGNVVKNAAINVLKALKNDKEIQDIIMDFCKVEELGLNYETVRAEFIEAIDEALYSFDGMSAEGFASVCLDVYVDNTGDLIGVSISVEDVIAESILVEKGSKYGYRFKAGESSEIISVEGGGKKSGDKRSGNFVVEYNTAEVVKIALDDVDTKKLSEGIFTGGITVQLADGAKAFLSGMGAPDYLYDMKVEMVSKSTSADKADFRLSVYNKDVLCASLVLEGKTKGADNIKVPKNAVDSGDYSAMTAWSSNLKLDKLKENLRNAGMPDEYVNLIQGSINF